MAMIGPSSPASFSALGAFGLVVAARTPGVVVGVGSGRIAPPRPLRARPLPGTPPVAAVPPPPPIARVSRGRRSLFYDVSDEEDEECPGAPFLWKIIDDATQEHVGFGLGTMHLPVDVVTTRGAYESILAAVQDSCDVYGELNPFDPSVAAQIQEECRSSPQVLNGATAADIPDEALREEVESKVAEVAATYFPDDPANAERTAAWMLGLPLPQLQQTIALANTPEYAERYLFANDTAVSLDEHVLSLGRPADGLEEVSTQCDIINSMYPSAEELQLMFSLFPDIMAESIRISLEESLSEGIRLYACGDVDRFVEEQALDMSIDEGAMDVILNQRNRQMAEAMVEALNANPGERVLFAVGLAHFILGGDESLTSLMKGRGYTLERVPDWEGGDAEDHTDAHCDVVRDPATGLFAPPPPVPSAAANSSAPIDALPAGTASNATDDDGGGDCPGAPFLWKIVEDATQEHVGFGLGTMHLPVDVVTTRGAYDSIQAAVQDSCDVFGELDPFDAAVAAQIQEECHSSPEVLNSATAADIPDKALREEVESKVTEVATTYFPGDSTNVELVSAWMLGLPLPQLQQTIELANTPEYAERYLFTTNTAVSLDDHVLYLGRPADGLEEVSTQCDILNSMYPSAEELKLMFSLYPDVMAEVIRNSLEESLSRTIQLYVCGDVDRFAEEHNPDMSIDEGSVDAILNQRNRQMAEAMVEALGANPGERVLFAVGLAHFIFGGDESLISLMKESGYTLERVPDWEGGSAEDHSNEHCGVVRDSVTGLFVPSVPILSAAANSTSIAPSGRPWIDEPPTSRPNVSRSPSSMQSDYPSMSDGRPNSSPSTAPPSSPPTGAPSSSSRAPSVRSGRPSTNEDPSTLASVTLSFEPSVSLLPSTTGEGWPTVPSANGSFAPSAPVLPAAANSAAPSGRPSIDDPPTGMASTRPSTSSFPSPMQSYYPSKSDGRLSSNPSVSAPPSSVRSGGPIASSRAPSMRGGRPSTDEEPSRTPAPVKSSVEPSASFLPSSATLPAASEERPSVDAGALGIGPGPTEVSGGDGGDGSQGGSVMDDGSAAKTSAGSASSTLFVRVSKSVIISLVLSNWVLG